MLKRLIASLALVLLALPAHAALVGTGSAPATQQGGFSGPGVPATLQRAQQIANAADNTPAVLTGHVVEQVAGSDDTFYFEDASGRVLVEIDQKVFGTQTVTPKDKVRLHGKVDKDVMEKTKLDVKMLEVLP
jgi:uncharacterized protein (TIGR00156 family)